MAINGELLLRLLCVMTGNGRAVGQEWNERCFANFHAQYGQYTYCITASNKSDGSIHIFNRKVNKNKSKRISLLKMNSVISRVDSTCYFIQFNSISSSVFDNPTSLMHLL